MNIGKKNDAGKPRWSLLPEGAIHNVVKVLEFGANRYGINNWQLVTNGKTRYYDAAMRHIEAWKSGNQNDEESGLMHLAHAVCCLLFIIWFENNEKT